jgi:hypothetical protein
MTSRLPAAFYDTLRKPIGRLAHRSLQAVEAQLLRRFTEPALPPLFIFGLPRSGTTLVYQYIVHRLPVAYFTNGADRYPQFPCLLTWIRHRIHGPYRSSFQNSYGQAPGPAAPHEAGGVWGRFFGFHDYVRPDEISGEDALTLQRIVACTEWVFGGAPFVNKNVKHLLRLHTLASIFPEARFLIVKRNLEDVALSLLRGRYANTGTASDFWSVRPQNAEELADLPPHEQIPRQLLALTDRLHLDLQSIADDRVFGVEYEEFCNAPDRLIGQVAPALGVEPDPECREVECFQVSRNEPETPEEKRLVSVLSSMMDDHQRRMPRTLS